MDDVWERIDAREAWELLLTHRVRALRDAISPREAALIANDDYEAKLEDCKQIERAMLDLARAIKKFRDAVAM